MVQEHENFSRTADLEVGDTAGLESCATSWFDGCVTEVGRAQFCCRKARATSTARNIESAIWSAAPRMCQPRKDSCILLRVAAFSNRGRTSSKSFSGVAIFCSSIFAAPLSEKDLALKNWWLPAATGYGIKIEGT